MTGVLIRLWYEPLDRTLVHLQLGSLLPDPWHRVVEFLGPVRDEVQGEVRDWIESVLFDQEM